MGRRVEWGCSPVHTHTRDGERRSVHRLARGRSLFVCELWQITCSHHLLVLVDTHVEGHVAGFGPSTEGGEPEDGVLEALGHEPLARVLHEEGVAGVRRVARLEGVDLHHRTQRTHTRVRVRGEQATVQEWQR